MAGGGVKKGFATYLFILFLALVAAFLTIVVIMIGVRESIKLR